MTTEQVRARLSALRKREVSTAEAHGLSLDVDRHPPKLFLRSAVPTIPPAAEINLRATEAGSSVVLRLMWGPLPAPFPRVVAALGVLLAVAVLIFGDGSTATTVGALVLAVLTIAALLIQRRGERRLQSELTRTLGVGAFRPVAH